MPNAQDNVRRKAPSRSFCCWATGAQVFTKESGDLCVVASGVDREKVLVFSPADHPQAFWPDGRSEQLLRLSECRVLVARSGHDEDGGAEAADRANRLEVAR